MRSAGFLPDEMLGGHHWRTGEERVLREHFPAGGIAACLPLLPRRSKRAIGQRAFVLGIKRKVA